MTLPSVIWRNTSNRGCVHGNRGVRQPSLEWPGDPIRAAEVVLELASMDHPPLRILLGRDGYEAAEKNDLAKIELGHRWKELSQSTDFPKPTDT